jgi:hypothetical protein
MERVKEVNVYFIYLYKNRTMKLESVLRRGKRELGKMMEELSLIKVLCKHV